MIGTSSTGNDTPKVFPKLMTDGVHVVLFTKEKRGTIVHKKKCVGTRFVGDCKSNWVMHTFRDTDEIITLCSKEVL